MRVSEGNQTATVPFSEINPGHVFRCHLGFYYMRISDSEVGARHATLRNGDVGIVCDLDWQVTRVHGVFEVKS